MISLKHLAPWKYKSISGGKFDEVGGKCRLRGGPSAEAPAQAGLGPLLDQIGPSKGVSEGQPRIA